MSFLRYFIQKLPEVQTALMQHIQITGLAVTIAILIGVPIGISITKSEKLSKMVLTIAGIFQTIPSLALFGLIIPIMGIGIRPAVFVLFLYSLLPIITNTYIGVKGVDNSTIQAAIGMGMTNFQVLTKVKLPIAVAVIMGGIRISTVATIGTATIAALIGAGGLGELIFRGISTSNNNLVLTGAIPTAILAFVANYFLGVLEKVLTPSGMLFNPKEKKKNIKVLKVALAMLVLGIGFKVYESSKTLNRPTIVVGHKTFPEQRILGNMISILITENTPYKVKLVELGGTNINFEAIKSGQIDIYPEYTGTSFLAILGEKEMLPPKEMFAKIKYRYNKEHDLDILAPIGFDNTYALAVNKELSKKFGITKISDLKNIADDFYLIGGHEFMERVDGLKGLVDTYGMNFKKVNSMEPGLIIPTLHSNKAEVGVVYSTDGLLEKYDLVVLEDDLKFFPPYEAVVTISNNAKDKFDVENELARLKNTFTNKDMQKLNLKAIEGKNTEYSIAKEALKSKGLIK
ncbi:glycine betaine ABC transporter substrate-binding protein [Cetobacterium sp.]|uniref:glycine betaine ABC transporter substrate-binding protein n=1 Tax=Cetobacterium sp. TaxID=2071632 RepID=UPI003AF1301B